MAIVQGDVAVREESAQIFLLVFGIADGIFHPGAHGWILRVHPLYIFIELIDQRLHAFLALKLALVSREVLERLVGIVDLANDCERLRRRELRNLVFVHAGPVHEGERINKPAAHVHHAPADDNGILFFPGKKLVGAIAIAADEALEVLIKLLQVLRVARQLEAEQDNRQGTQLFIVWREMGTAMANLRYRMSATADAEAKLFGQSAAHRGR